MPTEAMDIGQGDPITKRELRGSFTDHKLLLGTHFTCLSLFLPVYADAHTVNHIVIVIVIQKQRHNKNDENKMKQLMKQLSSMKLSSSDRALQLSPLHLNDNNNMTMGYFDTDEVVLGDRIGSSRYTDLYKVKSFHQPLMAETLVEQRGRDFMKKIAKRKENQYTIKFIQKEYMDSSHEEFEAAATSLANDAEMMAALNHHSIARLRGTSKAGTEAYYNTGRHDGYFVIVDCIQESLGQRLDTWRVRNNRIRLGRG
jgi:hypothetical protein